MGNVIFALFIFVGGFITSVVIFTIEMITSKLGIGKGLMNFYDNRMEERHGDDFNSLDSPDPPQP